MILPSQKKPEITGPYIMDEQNSGTSKVIQKNDSYQSCMPSRIKRAQDVHEQAESNQSAVIMTEG